MTIPVRNWLSRVQRVGVLGLEAAELHCRCRPDAHTAAASVFSVIAVRPFAGTAHGYVPTPLEAAVGLTDCSPGLLCRSSWRK